MTLLSKVLNVSQRISPRVILSIQLKNGVKPNYFVRYAGGGPRMLRAKSVHNTGFKPLFIRYFFVGLVPAALIIAYSNLFIGEAVLYDHDPDVYEPECWEYYKHPITRFLARHVMEDPKLSYYKDIYNLELEHRTFKQTQLINQVESLQELEKEGMIEWQKKPALDRWESDAMDEYAEQYAFSDKSSQSSK